MWTLIYKTLPTRSIPAVVGKTMLDYPYQPEWYEVWDCDNNGVPLGEMSYFPDSQGEPRKFFKEDYQKALRVAWFNNERMYKEK